MSRRQAASQSTLPKPRQPAMNFAVLKHRAKCRLKTLHDVQQLLMILAAFFTGGFAFTGPYELISPFLVMVAVTCGWACYRLGRQIDTLQQALNTINGAVSQGRQPDDTVLRHLSGIIYTGFLEIIKF